MRHRAKFREDRSKRFADVKKLSWEKRTEASKFTKMGTWSGYRVTQGHWQCHNY